MPKRSLSHDARADLRASQSFVWNALVHKAWTYEQVIEVLDWLNDYIEYTANSDMPVEPLLDMPEGMFPFALLFAVSTANTEYLKSLGCTK